jgi:hypothetical protein
MAFERIFFIAADKIPLATLTQSTEATNYGKANIASDLLTEQTRTTVDTSSTFAADHGSALGMRAVVVAGHNITSGNTVLLIEADNASDFLSIDFTQNFVWNAGYMPLKFAATQTWRYWRLRVADAANPDTYIAIGKWSLGAIIQLSRNYFWDWTETFQQFGDTVRGSTGNTQTVRRATARVFDLSFINGNADRALLRTLWRDTQGLNIWMFLDYDAHPNELTIWGKLQPLRTTERNVGLWPQSFQFVEEVT